MDFDLVESRLGMKRVPLTQRERTNAANAAYLRRKYHAKSPGFSASKRPGGDSSRNMRRSVSVGTKPAVSAGIDIRL